MKKLLGLVIALTLGLGLFPAMRGAELRGTLSIVGSTSVQPLAEELARAYMAINPKVTITVAGGGSGAGIRAARAGTADIGASSRELKPEEKAGLVAAVIARDGIAVVVNKANGVSALTIEQVAKIYSGQIANWKELGGPDARIVLISRESGSGTRGAFEELVLGKLAVASSMMQQGSTGAVRQTVAVTESAIGYISLGQIDGSVKALRIDGVAPSEANVLNKTYRISRPFLFVTKGAPKDLAKSFIDFVLGPAGQSIVAKEFVPVGRMK